MNRIRSLLLAATVLGAMQLGSSLAEELVLPVGFPEEMPTYGLPNPNGFYVSSDYLCALPGLGFHAGVDLAYWISGGEVRAIADGTVVGTRRSETSTWGNAVLIRHDKLPDGPLYSLYGHLQAGSPWVGLHCIGGDQAGAACTSTSDCAGGTCEGDRVYAGQPIGRVGTAGDLGGPHLHFELKRVANFGYGYFDAYNEVSDLFEARRCNNEQTRPCVTDADCVSPGGCVVKASNEAYLAPLEYIATQGDKRYSTKFALGEEVAVTADAYQSVNVRATPQGNVCDLSDGNTSGTQPPGARGVVTDGPVFTYAYWWWEIDFEEGPDGWVAQDFLQDTAGGTTERVSVASDGTQGNEHSGGRSSISAEGRFVAFSSGTSNLVPEDTNEWYDVFVHDRQADLTERVSVASDGMQGNEQSGHPSISADGRFVAFGGASDLVPDDTNDRPDVFVHDRQSGLTERVSVASDGTQTNDSSYWGSISADGRFVAFHSHASDLVPDDTNDRPDVFVHDRQSGLTERVSVASDGAQGKGWSAHPSISADGRFVAFDGASTLLPDAKNTVGDIFVHDRKTGLTERVSVASDGTQGNDTSREPSISADGRFVAFRSYAANLVPDDTNDRQDVFVHDRQSGRTERVSVASNGAQGDSASVWATHISADGRFVAFVSGASNLVPNDTNEQYDIFVHDRQSGHTERVSVASDGTQGNSYSGGPSISADGRFVAFGSSASNLVTDDTNERDDVFVHVRGQVGPSPLAAP